MSETFQQVTVAVPTTLVPEFYEMLGRWLGDRVEHGEIGAGGPRSRMLAFAEGSVEDIADWWDKLTRPARRIFVFLAENRGDYFYSYEIAEACDIDKGASGVAGTLSAPTKRAHGLGLTNPLTRDRESKKWSMDHDVATLIQHARQTTGDA